MSGNAMKKTDVRALTIETNLSGVLLLGSGLEADHTCNFEARQVQGLSDNLRWDAEGDPDYRVQMEMHLPQCCL
jgi:hypothetical protein